MRLSVVLPVYRTAECLRELHARLDAVAKALKTDGLCSDAEFVMVDDGSPDGAWETIQLLAASDPRVKGIRLSRNFGQHPAIAAGFRHATGDAIVLMDADLQDRPEDIPLLLTRLTGTVDVVYSVKDGGEPESHLTLWSSRLYHFAVSRMTGATIPSDIGTLRVVSRRFLDAILSYPERTILFGPLMFYIGFDSDVVRVRHDPRPFGRSAYSFRRRLGMAVHSLISYTDLPHRFLMTAGATILGTSVLYAIALVIGSLLGRHGLLPGITLLALLVTLSLGSIMLSLGILGMYIFRVYQEVLRRPRYIISRSLNLEKACVDDIQHH
jgi:glycosyltransferase involved in cell wall biosynthesis